MYDDIFIISDSKVQDAKNITLSNIEYLNFQIDFHSYDALVITSKNALKALDIKTDLWKEKELYTISGESAAEAGRLGAKRVHVSKGNHGKEFAQEICSKLQKKEVLYIRGEKVAFDIANELRTKGIKCDSLIVYKNSFLKPTFLPDLPNNAKIIFPSPSSVENFLKVFEWKDSYTAIAIGKTSYEALPNFMRSYISDETSFVSCVKKAKEI